MPWKKGVSGNPKGKPKGAGNKARILAEKFLPHVAAAVRATVKNLEDPDSAVVQRAAKEVLDRVFGTAPQQVEIKGDNEAPIQHIITIKHS